MTEVTGPGYRLILGDCLDVLPGLGKVDAIICDPPYGTTACAWDTVIPFATMWDGVRHVLKPRGAAVFFASQPFTSALVMSNPKWFKYAWVWEKQKPTGFLQAGNRPLCAHEDIAVFGKSTPAYNPQGTRTVAIKSGRKNKGGSLYRQVPGKNYVQTVGNYPQTVFRFCTDTTALHPTQKPVALLRYLVRTYTNPGETVLDFTMGSGTTGVACIMEGRRFIGVELDPTYHAIAARRLADAAAQPMLIPSAESEPMPVQAVLHMEVR